MGAVCNIKAPALFHKGDKWDGAKEKERRYTAIPYDIFEILYNEELQIKNSKNGCGALSQSEIILLVYLMGQKDDGSFRIPINNPCFKSKSTYLKTRAVLVQRGWLEHVEGVSITINYDAIRGKDSMGTGVVEAPSRKWDFDFDF